MFPIIKAVIFDMDGLMIDSETIYTRITADLLRPYGKTMSYEVKAGLMGKNSIAAAAFLIEAVGLENKTPEGLIAEMEPMLQAAFENVPALPGVEKLVAHLVKHKIPMAIATGSKTSSFHLKTSHLGHIFSPFGSNIICGDNPILGGKCKPDPTIFLEAAKLLNLTTQKELSEILVFEDGVLGVQACANTNGMNCIWVPDPEMLKIDHSKNDLKFVEQLSSIEEFKPELYGLPSYEI